MRSFIFLLSFLFLPLLSYCMDPNTQLLRGATDNDIKQVLLALEKGANLNVRGPYNATPLIIAARAGLNDIVKLLIKAGSDVNATSKDNMTALMEATVLGPYGRSKNPY